MSNQKIDHKQSNRQIADIGASTKSAAQLVIDYPTAQAGQFVISETEFYLCVGANKWKVFVSLPDYLAFKNLNNRFHAKQTIETGGIETEAPEGEELTEMLFGDVTNSVDELEIDPNKYLPVRSNGVKFKLPILRMATQPASNTHPLSGASTSGAACTLNSPINYYSADESLVVGSILYTDASLTSTANAGYYSDNSAWYQADANGEIIAKGQCAVATTNEFLAGNKSLVYDNGGNGIHRQLVHNISNSLPVSISPSPQETSTNATATVALQSTTSTNSIFKIVINASGAITAQNFLNLTDGTNTYLGTVSGNGTSRIEITFDIGTAKGRTLQWGDGAEINIQPA